MTRSFLESARKYESDARRYRMEIEVLRASLHPSAMRYDIPKVQTSPEDVIAKVEARIDELERKIERAELLKAAAIVDIGKAIDEVQERRTAEIMTEYFIQCKSSKEIGAERGYTPRWINRLMQIEIERMNK